MDALISEFSSSGCNSVNIASLCAQVFLELIEVKRYWDVSYKYDDKLNIIYCKGRKTKHGRMSIFVPVSVNDLLSFEQMQELLSLLKNEENNDTDSLFLTICTNDATNVYYEISNGIGASIVSKSTKKHHLNCQIVRDKVLEKNIDILKEAAMCNIPVTLTKQHQEVSCPLEDSIKSQEQFCELNIDNSTPSTSK